MSLGPTEIILIVAVILLLFVGKKIPELARGLGKGIREFKKAKDDIHDTIEREADDLAREEKAKTPAAPAESPEELRRKMAEMQKKIEALEAAQAKAPPPVVEDLRK